jgi:hypothetical protein
MRLDYEQNEHLHDESTWGILTGAFKAWLVMVEDRICLLLCWRGGMRIERFGLVGRMGGCPCCIFCEPDEWLSIGSRFSRDWLVEGGGSVGCVQRLTESR